MGEGIPFREAHEIVGRLVLGCEREGRRLQDLSDDELAAASPGFRTGSRDIVDVDAVVARRTSAGGTGHEAVRAQIELAKRSLDGDRGWLASHART